MPSTTDPQSLAARLQNLSMALADAPDLTPQGADLMVRLDYVSQHLPVQP